MQALNTITAILFALSTFACGTTSGGHNQISVPQKNSDDSSQESTNNTQDIATSTGQFLTTINENNVSVQLIIDKPAIESADVVMTFHGTVETDDKIVQAAQKTLDETKKIVNRQDILFISVAYPEEGLFMGDNLKHAEAALLWAKQKASKALNIKTKRIFLVGHSQGGYLVTRLNTMHPTDGVIANAPGPLNLRLRCELEEKGKIPESGNCRRIRDAYGSTESHPDAYLSRSLLSHLQGFKSRILFTQGMSDTRLQLTSWPLLKEKVSNCSDCAKAQFEELDGEHAALFSNPKAPNIVAEFIK